MTDPWTDPEDALFTNPDWEDPFPYEEADAPWWLGAGVTPEFLLAFEESLFVEMGEPDFYAPRARWVADR